MWGPAEAGAVTRTVIGGDAPTGDEARSQVTVAAPTAQDQPVPLAPMALTPTGRVSTTWTSTAEPGPALSTCRVKSRVWPGAAAGDAAVLVIDRSATAASTLSTSSSELAAGPGSVT